MSDLLLTLHLWLRLFRGMQTWEYAPQYALRTYAYLLPMAGIAKICQLVLDALPANLIEQLSRLLMLPSYTSTTMLGSGNKPLLFALLRVSLAITSSYAEISFFRSIHDRISPNLAYMTAFAQLTSAGFFHANQAYLPSSSVMMLWQLSIANQFRENHGWAIFLGLLAVLAVGWPFCAVLFVTTGCWALTSSKSKQTPTHAVMCVLLRTLLHTIAIQAVIFAVDYYYYGKLVSPIWNIFSYNARGGGDELYGIEPLSYYFKNIALNFNFLGILGVVALPILLIKILLRRSNSSDSLKLLGLVPMYIWMTIVLPRPHKEERFLFPMYPMLCFGAAITADEIMNTLSSLLPGGKKCCLTGTSRLMLRLLVLSPAAIISISRSLALHHYYTAPLALYSDLFHRISSAQPDTAKRYVCTGGEWYRFPTSFFLPENIQLGFLKSSFGGQLPQPFTSHGSKSKSLEVQTGRFNDMNMEEVDRYLDINECSYIVEMVSNASEKSPETPECLHYMDSDTSGSWSIISSFRYLDAESTPALHRILYLPFGREGKVQFKDYNLYSRSKMNPE
jgi:alpha-1,2-mannosyltransferase